jgi:hypothetical protein
VFAKLCGLETVDLLTDVATPSLEHLGKTAGCQLQRALSHVLMEFAYDFFNANPHIDPSAKIANAACAAIGAGAWMEDSDGSATSRTGAHHVRRSLRRSLLPPVPSP